MENQDSDKEERKILSDSLSPIGIYLDMEKFVYSNPFLIPKMIKGRLFCDKCGCEFPSTLPFFIVLNEEENEIMCHPCDRKRNGIDIEEENRKKRKEIVDLNLPKVEPKLKGKKVKKKKQSNQGNLF